LTGCGTPSVVTKPELIEVTRWRTQAIPDELTLDRSCPDAEDLQRTQDIVSAYQACWTANEGHNVDKAKIRGLTDHR
jgi:hypothetical protein